MRVAHVITGLNRGGAEAMLAKLLQALPRPEFDPLVVSLLAPGPIGGRILELGVAVESLGLERGWASPLAVPLSVPGLARILRRFRPDLVQTWLYHGDLLGLAAARLTGRAPVVWNLRCSDMDFSRTGRGTRLVAALCARLSRWPAAVVANSQAAVEAHQRLGYRPRRLEVIPNGFDLERFRPDLEARAAVRRELGLDPQAPLVGMAARLDPQKDHPGFLRAMAMVRAAVPGACFVLCGDGVGPGDAAVADMIRAAGLAGSGPGGPVLALGPRPDLHRLYPAWDVAVLSSAYGEGFPNVVGEAMACGTPCVVTDVGDAKDVVGEAGVVVPPRDPGALAGAVIRLLGLLPGERQALGRAARARIQARWSLASVAGRYAALYRELAPSA